ncbi:MAG: serine hydrolase domain-containing protein [Dehalococcoidia bacterium]
MSWSRLLDIRTVLAAIVVGALACIGWQELSADDPPPSDGTHLNRIFSYVQQQMNDSSIPGAGLAIVNSDGSVQAKGFGEDGHGNAITPDTPFWIGSNTKSFTALAIMQLHEAGKLDIDAPVQRYVPEFHVANAEVSTAITVKMLLNQTSGLSRADGIKPLLEGKEQTLEEAVADIATLRLNRPVGRTYEYSNLNFVIAGLIVERVSGQSWTDYVQTQIFDPLEMRNSYTSLDEAKANGLSAVHRYLFGFPVETDADYLPGLASTGYLYSSAGDMAHYLSMYLNGGVYNGRRLLSEQGIAAMLSGETNDSSRTLLGHSFDFEYGRGWFVGPFGAADDARWHLGDLYSFTAWMVLLPDTEQAVVVLMNAGSAFELAGATAPLSRIPIGVVNVLRGENPPAGMGFNRFYVIFDAAVLIVLALQVWSLGRLVTRGLAPAGVAGWATACVPFVWELGVAGFLLLQFPPVMGGGWQAAIRTLPDLSLVVLAVSLLWLLTGVARAVQLLRMTATSRAQQVASQPGQQLHRA